MRRWVIPVMFFLAVGVSTPDTAVAGGDKGKDPYQTAESHFAKGEWSQAMGYYRRALATNDVRAHYRMGLIEERNGNRQSAAGHYRRYLDLGQPGAFWDDAAARLKALESEQAASAPRSSQLLESGRSLYAAGKYREAEARLLEALKVDPENPEVHFYLGEVYLELKDYAAAERHFLRAKELY